MGACVCNRGCRRRSGKFWGKHPKDLFNKSGVANGHKRGNVIEEMGDNMVVSGDSEDSHFDVTKSEVYRSGGSVVVNREVLCRKARA